MQITLTKLSEIHPYPKNARKIPQSAIDAVAKSIQEFSWQQPIVTDRDGVIIVGHCRLLAAHKLGLTEAPVHVAEHLTPAQVRQYRLMDNRSHEEAKWDMDILKSEMFELKALDLDMSLTGFDPYMWSSMVDGAAPQWSGMPAFGQEDQLAWQTVSVHFLTERDRQQFSTLVGQPISDKTKYLWFPHQATTKRTDKAYVTPAAMNPRYPVYVISKGRWETRLTSKALEKIGIPYRIVVEPQEREQYAAVIDASKILTLPFSNLGEGSIPARNWVWEHSSSEGHARHWILDDNIRIFYRMNQNLKMPIASGAVFCAAEDYTDRYENVGLSGFNYQWLAKQKQKIGPFNLNTRIYSCILVDNALPFRWRGRYNEDTDLSLRVLKSGRCTILFNAFLADKQATMTMKGGNTEELYGGDGRYQMAKSLQDQHPDVVKIAQKFKRWQHQVDYRPFRNNAFIPRPGFTEPDQVNDYGMELKYIETGEPVGQEVLNGAS